MGVNANPARRARGRPSDHEVKVVLCRTHRCNKLTANKGGLCKRCLDTLTPIRGIYRAS